LNQLSYLDRKAYATIRNDRRGSIGYEKVEGFRPNRF
jgi:hypothetical protein